MKSTNPASTAHWGLWFSAPLLLNTYTACIYLNLCIEFLRKEDNAGGNAGNGGKNKDL